MAQAFSKVEPSLPGETERPRSSEKVVTLMEKTLTGRCLCEGIVYQITGGLGPIFNCHCSKCRRWHGAVYRTRASVRKAQFEWLEGEELLSFYQSSENVTKCFCSRCGSSLVSSYKNRPEILGVPLGGLEQDPGGRPEAHIFVGSKAPWFDITDGPGE